MHARLAILLSPLLLAAVPGLAAAQGAGAPAATAQADLRDAQGASVGQVRVRNQADGVGIAVNITKLPPGSHGFHIHTVGRCEPNFDAAGGHYNPGGRKHGLKAAGGPHAGDLPNLQVSADGSATAEFVQAGVTVAELLADDGSAMVIHANADDDMTDPAGNSGARIACGVLRGQPGG